VLVENARCFQQRSSVDAGSEAAKQERETRPAFRQERGSWPAPAVIPRALEADQRNTRLGAH